MNKKATKLPILLTTEHLADGSYPTELGSTVFVSHTQASNVVRDLQENIRNLVGGRMKHYDLLIETAAEHAFEKLRRNLLDNGWDGAIAVRISHPTVVEGGCEVIVYGTPFRH